MGLQPKNLTKKKQTIVFFLGALSLFCIITLDYIASKQRQSSYFFRSSLSQPKTSSSTYISPSLADVILSTLFRLGVPKDAVQSHLDNQNTLHVLVNLPAHEYSQLVPSLKKQLASQKYGSPLIEQHQLGTTSYHLWNITRDQNKVVILFQSPLRLLRSRKTLSSSLTQIKRQNKVAIIIDDMGNSLKAIDSICRLGYPVTIAILPHSQFAQETAQLAHQYGLEVLLHLPLEPLPGNNNSHGNSPSSSMSMIHSQMATPEIVAFINDCLQNIPYAIGVNNHQGSLITSNPRLMTIILQEIKKRGLIFIDSRTTNQSVAYQIAKSLNIPTSYRKIFLDNEVSSPKIKEQFIKLLQRARHDGWAVAIGHPWEETLLILKENQDLFSEYDCQPVPVSEIVPQSPSD